MFQAASVHLVNEPVFATFGVLVAMTPWMPNLFLLNAYKGLDPFNGLWIISEVRIVKN